jgi:hypothetical protein
LAQHCINNKENLIRLYGITNLARLCHQLRIDTKPAGCINDHKVMQLIFGEFLTRLRYLDGIANAVTWLGCKDRDSYTRSNLLQLVNGIGALQI